MRFTLLGLAAVLVLAGCRAPHDRDWFEKLPGEAGNTECPPAEPVIAPGYQVPHYEIVEEPVYEECRVPIWGEKTVPVYAERRVPVTLPTYDMCQKCEKEAVLWHKKTRVQVGVKRVPACIGYRTERRQVGTCRRCVQKGWRTVNPCADPNRRRAGPVARAAVAGL